MKQSTLKTPTIGFAGMTHLGINSAAAAAAHGFPTVCHDADPALLADLAAGRPPVVEPGLPDLLAAHGHRLSYAADPAALAVCDVVFIASDVPTDDRGHSDLSPIRNLIDRVIPVLGPETVLVILCQVPPGFTRTLPVSPERLFYQVETLIFGRAVERALAPERFIVGSAAPERALPPAFAAYLDAFGCPVLPMRYESAELAKISINMCLVASICVANTLSEICEGIGADWSEIVPALRLDKRIGPHAYLSPGLGIAGGNLERDLATVIQLSHDSGTNANIVQAWLDDSAYRRDWVLRQIHRSVLPHIADPVFAVLGLAYKENTASTKNSPAIATLDALHPFRVRVFDPAVPAEASGHPRAEAADTALAAVDGVDALLIMTPWPEFRRIVPADLIDTMAGRTIIDPYGALDAQAFEAAGFRHFVCGQPNPARSSGT
jgi:UDPglucose 6-dehydrogenase